MSSQSRKPSHPPSGIMRMLPRKPVICILLICCCLAVIVWLTFEQGNNPSQRSSEERWLHAKILPETETDRHRLNGVVVMQDEEQPQKHPHDNKQAEQKSNKKTNNKGRQQHKGGDGKKGPKGKEDVLMEKEDFGMNEQEAERWINDKIKMEYCNPPRKTIVGEEGKFKPGYDLKAVYVIVRHGDRTPMTEFSSIPNSTWQPRWNCDLNHAVKTIQSDTLREFVTSLQRELKQGDMSGVSRTFQNLPVGRNEMCSKSQLTPIGWLQHLELGKYLRNVYGTTLVSDPEKLSNISSFKSTSNSRTQQSAFAFMYGFFKNATLEDTTRINMVPKLNFCPLEMCACPALDRLLKEKDSQYSKKMHGNPKFMQVMKSVAKTLYGTAQSNLLPGINAVAEILAVLVCHNLPYPYGAGGTITPIQHALYHQQLEETWQSGSHLKDGIYEKVGRMFIHPMLSDMLKTFYKVSQRTHKRLFLLNSGHDITIRPIVDALKLSGPGWPHYASRVVFELWGKSKPEEHYIRVLAYGKDQTQKVLFCRENLTEDGLCPLSSLLRFVETDNMEYFYSSSYQEACARTYWPQ